MTEHDHLVAGVTEGVDGRGGKGGRREGRGLDHALSCTGNRPLRESRFRLFSGPLVLARFGVEAGSPA
ncbi:MAG: hypothetical protein ACK55I_32825, partial [bacterium]